MQNYGLETRLRYCPYSLCINRLGTILLVANKDIFTIVFSDLQWAYSVPLYNS